MRLFIASIAILYAHFTNANASECSWIDTDMTCKFIETLKGK